MKYEHYFDIRLANSFESETEDFDVAFEEWAKTFSSSKALRQKLLHSDESIKTIMRGIVWSETWCEDEANMLTPD